MFWIKTNGFSFCQIKKKFCLGIDNYRRWVTRQKRQYFKNEPNGYAHELIQWLVALFKWYGANLFLQPPKTALKMNWIAHFYHLIISVALWCHAICTPQNWRIGHNHVRQKQLVSKIQRKKNVIKLANRKVKCLFMARPKAGQKLWFFMNCGCRKENLMILYRETRSRRIKRTTRPFTKKYHDRKKTSSDGSLSWSVIILEEWYQPPSRIPYKHAYKS